MDRVEEVYKLFLSSRDEVTCYSALRDAEVRSAPKRVEELKALLSVAKERETELQERFKARVPSAYRPRTCMPFDV